jgi:hypothetical protein
MRSGFLTLAVVFELRQLSEASYFVRLGSTGFLGIGQGADFFERTQIMINDHARSPRDDADSNSTEFDFGGGGR